MNFELRLEKGPNHGCIAAAFPRNLLRSTKFKESRVRHVPLKMSLMFDVSAERSVVAAHQPCLRSTFYNILYRIQYNSISMIGSLQVVPLVVSMVELISMIQRFFPVVVLCNAAHSPSSPAIFQLGQCSACRLLP